MLIFPLWILGYEFFQAIYVATKLKRFVREQETSHSSRSHYYAATSKPLLVKLKWLMIGISLLDWVSFGFELPNMFSNDPHSFSMDLSSIGTVLIQLHFLFIGYVFKTVTDALFPKRLSIAPVVMEIPKDDVASFHPPQSSLIALGGLSTASHSPGFSDNRVIILPFNLPQLTPSIS